MPPPRRATPFDLPQPSSVPRFGLAWYFFSAVVVVYFVGAFWYGGFATDTGRELRIREEATLRSYLIEVPTAERDWLWSAQELIVTAVWTLPVLSVGHGFDLQSYAREQVDKQGSGMLLTPYRDAVALHSYETVMRTSRVVGAANPWGMHPQSRARLEKDLGSLNPSEPGFATGLREGETLVTTPLEKEEAGARDPAIATATEIRQTVVTNVWHLYFGQTPPAYTVKLLGDVLGKAGTAFQFLMHMTRESSTRGGPTTTRPTMNTMWDYMTDLARNGTPLVQELTRAAEELLRRKAGAGAAEDSGIVRAVQQHFMYNVLAPSVALVDSVVGRLRSDPDFFLPMWRAGPRSFLLETLRLEPLVAVQQATLPLGTPGQTFGLAGGYRATGVVDHSIAAGDALALFTSNANVDTTVFGGPQASHKYARTFDPVHRTRESLLRVITSDGVAGDVLASPEPGNPKGDTASDRRAAGKASSPFLALPLVLDLATLVVERHLPPVGDAEWNRTPARRAVRNTHDAAIAAFAFTDEANYLVRYAAVGVWVFIAFLVLGNIRSQPWGPCSAAAYLLVFGYTSMAGLSLPFGKPAIYDHSLLIVAHGMALVALVARGYFHDPDYYARPTASSGSDVAAPGAPLAPGSGALNTAFAFLHTSVAVHYHLLTSEGDRITLGSMQVVMAGQAFPGVPLTVYPLLVLTLIPFLRAVWRFWRTECDPKLRGPLNVFLVAVGIRTSVEIVASFMAQEHFLSRGTMALTAVGLSQIFFLPAAVFTLLAINQRLLRGSRALLIPNAAGGKAKAKQTEAQCREQRSFVRAFWFYVSLLVLIAAIIPGVAAVLRSGRACFAGEEHESPDKAALCAEAAAYLNRIDSATTSFLKLSKTLLPVGRNSGPDSYTFGTEVKIPTKQHRLKKVAHLHGLEIPLEDEDYGEDKTLMQTIVFGYLFDKTINPIAEAAADFDSQAHGSQIMRLISSDDLDHLKLYPWKEMQSDESISRWAFAGMAAHLLRRAPPGDFVTLTTTSMGAATPANEAPRTTTKEIRYVVDLGYLSGLALRPGFEAYGAVAHFAEDAELVKMTVYTHNHRHGGEGGTADLEVVAHNVTRDSPNNAWARAKWTFKVTTIVSVTVKDHLTKVHYMGSNFLATSLFENMAPAHPLRRFLRPFTMGANSVNMAASRALSTECGLVHRASALTRDSFFQALDLAWRTSDITTWSDMEANGMLPDARNTSSPYSFGHDALRFRDIVADVVDEYVDLYYPTDESLLADRQVGDFWHDLAPARVFYRMPELTDKATFKRQIVVCIMLVTAVHNHVGNVADYLSDPGFAAAKIRHGAVMADFQSSMQAMNIALLTAMKTPPLINDFTHLLLRDEHLNATKAILGRFQTKLKAMAADVDQANEHRRFPGNSFNPRFVLSSVSV